MNDFHFDLAEEGSIDQRARATITVEEYAKCIEAAATVEITVDSFAFSYIAALMLINMALIGIVLMALGLIALYIARIHEEVQGRPMYIVKERKNIK